MIALLAGNELGTLRLAAFEKILAADFQGGFGCFGAAGSEEDAAGAVGGVAEIGGREREEALGEFRGGTRREVGRVGVREGARLLGNGARDGFNAVADGDNGSASASVEDFATVGGEYKAAFAANGFRVLFPEAAGEKSVSNFFALSFPWHRNTFVNRGDEHETRPILAEMRMANENEYCTTGRSDCVWIQLLIQSVHRCS